MIYLSDIKQNLALASNEKCFNGALTLILFDSTYNLLTLSCGSLVYVLNRQYQIYVSTVYNNIEYYQKVLINILPPPTLPIPLIT